MATDQETARADRRLIALFAFACGAGAANLYYAQPLLVAIGRRFGVSDGTAGLLVTVVQVGYGVGLLFVVPLGDLIDRRTLIARLLTLCCAALTAAALAPSFWVLLVSLAVAGLASVVVQVLVPYVSTLVAPERRGATVGTVMSGLLIGVLLARTVSGLIASVSDWRVPFLAAAVLMLALAWALWRRVPASTRRTTLSYGALLASVGALVAREPALRRRMVYGALSQASFTLIWTTIAFLLARPPFGYSEATIGLFGLAGLIGAVGARRLGAVADRGHGRLATVAVLGLVLIGWGVLAGGDRHASLIVLGLVVLDFGTQGQNVLSQQVIYGIGREQASRISTAYTSTIFAGGAVGSALGAAAWGVGGFRAVCACGAVLAALALVLSCGELLGAHRRSATRRRASLSR